jgi:long-chain acyl-CoA synthetase
MAALPINPQWRGLTGLAQQRAQRPNATALVCEQGRFSFADLDAHSSQMACLLERTGVKPGDRLGIFAENGWLPAVAVLAALKVGALFVVLHPQFKAAKLASIIEDAGISVILTQSSLLNTLQAAQTAAQCQVLCDGEEIPAPVIDLRQALACISAADSAAFTAHTSEAEEPCAIIYTSGTTGEPKGVVHNHRSMVFALCSISAYLPLRAQDVVLSVLPLAFSYGLYQWLLCLWNGACLVLEKSFNFPAQIYQRLRDEQVSVFPAIPTVFALMAQAHARSALCFAQVRCITNAGAALPPSLIAPLQEIFPQAQIFAMYGQTECNRGCYLPPQLLTAQDQAAYWASVGKAIPGTELFLVDEAFNRLEGDAEGILCVQGPHLMLGYWNKPESTAKALRKDNAGQTYLYTGDCFYRNSDGFYFFRGRSDDIIKVRGEKVSPVEIEHALSAVPGIAEAAVLAVADELLGQAVVGFVAFSEAPIPERLIKQALNKHLEPHKIPKQIIAMAALPKTANGKLDKKSLAIHLPQT